MSGSILDSTTKAGIGGATVELRGTSHHATTDPAGSFRFDSLPPGAYTMLVTVRAPVILLRAITLTVDDSPVRADIMVPATAIAIANAERERARLVGQCAKLRLARERKIDSTLAVPISKWSPS